MPKDIKKVNSLLDKMNARLNEPVSNKKKGEKNVDRMMEISFKTLRYMAHKDSLISGIIKKRCDQVKPFLRPLVADRYDEDERGFRVVRRNNGETDKKSKELTEFFSNTGFDYDPKREDDIINATDLIIRDLLTIDQVAIEIRRRQNGDVFDFWVLDGATIVRTFDKKHTFAQDISKASFATDLENKSLASQEKNYTFFTNDDIIFDYMNERSDIAYRGYGYSPIESSIDLITTFLFGINYNRDQFIRDKVPKGFLKVMGDVNSTTLNQIRNYWYQQMSGYGARFKIPIIPSGKEGVGMDWQQIGHNNRDMEFHKLIQLVMSLKASCFGIDLAELGIKTDDSQSIIGESGEPRLQNSKDSGLGSLLIFIEQLYNKILRKIDEDYAFEFVGVKNDDKKAKSDLAKARLDTVYTIDEIRELNGQEPFNEKWSKIPLNDKVVQMIQAEQLGEAGQEDDSFGSFGGSDTNDTSDVEKSKRDTFSFKEKKQKNKIWIV